MSEWQPSSLAELIEIKHGYAFKGEHFVDYPTKNVLVTPGNFAIGGGFKFDKLKYYDGPVPEDYILRPGDLIVTMTDLSKQADTLGYSAVVPRSEFQLLHNQRIGLVTSRDNAVGLDFLGWLMRTPAYRACIVGSATGSTVKHTSPSRIKEFEFLLPPLEDRCAISAILDALDDKIELNRRMNETLEAQARALFRDWFVDFGPVKAKMAGNAPYLAPDLWSLFPDSLDPDGLPEGWKIRTASDLFDIRIGRTPPRKEAEHFLDGRSGVPWLSIKTMGVADPFIFDTEESLTEVATKAFRVPTVKEGTVLVSFKLTVGRVAIAGREMATNEAIAHFNETSASLGLSYSYFYLKNFDYNRLGSTSSIATAVNSKTIKNIPFLVPAKEVTSAFRDLADPLLKQIRSNILESRTLAQTRDLLLPKLMSGEIRVSTAEAQLAAVV